jgi:hypothetical protein
MGYHAFKDDEGGTFGSFETFEITAVDGVSSDCTLEPGFYWQACFPGCLADGAPMGPFDTESAAIEDAQGQ